MAGDKVEDPYARFLRVFLEECSEYVGTLEAGLLVLERNPDERDTIDSVFRAAHSMKGGGASLGLKELADFTHVMESVLDRVRDGSLRANAAVVGVLLKSVDVVKVLLAAAQAGVPANASDAEIVQEQLSQFCQSAPQHEQPPVAVVGKPVTATKFRVDFCPGSELFRGGLDSVLLLRELVSEATAYTVECHERLVPPLSEIDPETSYLSWSVELETELDANALLDVFSFSGGSDVALVHDLSSAPTLKTEEASAIPAEASGRGPSKSVGTIDTASIRVSTQKVDSLIDIVGELIIAQSMLKDAANGFTIEKLAALQTAVREIERSTRDLQDRVMGIRMLPVNNVFQRFPRMVRDLATSLGKNVDFVVQGGDIELDKTVIDLIGDPLTHLLRNAVDHGIETPDLRVAAGKDAQAQLTLKAFHEGGAVVVMVEDDGRGLDLPRIRAKAIERGIVGESQTLTETETIDLIFAPGFSTAETVSNVSGRGVGMDVVKRSILSLNGSIRVENLPGQGARFYVSLPLTLAILDGLSVAVGNEIYVLPLLSVVQSFRPRPDDVRSVLGQDDVVRALGETLPLVRLGEVFQVPGCAHDASVGLVVIVENGGRRFALLVDDIRGRSQVVMKSLATNFQRIPGVMGATILGDGHVALILDVKGLGQLARLPSGVRRTEGSASTFSVGS